MGSNSGGYFTADWTPPALVLATLVLFGLATGAFRGAKLRLGTLAFILFGIYTAWSFVSILWSPNKGDAWLGASLTLLYLLTMWATGALVTMGASRRWVLTASALGPAAVAAFTLWSLDPHLGGFFADSRLIGTVGYYNGEAAFLLVPFWAAIYLSGSPRVNLVLRGVLLAGAVLSVDVAVLAQSRGALVAMAASLPVFFLLSGQRLRGLLALTPVAAALLVAFANLNDIYLAFLNHTDPAAAISRATPAVWLTAAGAGLYGVLWGIIDRKWTLQRGVTRIAGAVALTVLVITAVGGTSTVIERVGDPVTLAQQKWEAFKTNDTTGEKQSRYLSASGQGRYYLWQIAWKDFTSHPVLGVGTNNYEATYYKLRDQTRTGSVRQPHMLPLEVLGERGLVGGILFFGFLATCVISSLRERFRHLTSEGKAQVGALLAAVTYWFVHSSAEWFWQIPAITLPAMVYLAMLATTWRRSETSALGWSWRLAGSGLAILAVLAILPLYIADRYLTQTYETTDPGEGLVAIERAERFDPLDQWLFRREAELAIKLGDRKRAESAYSEAIRLNPEHYAPYAVLAAFYDQRKEFGKALPLYQQALALNPLDANLNRQEISLLAQVPSKNVDVRFVSGQIKPTHLNLQVAHNTSKNTHGPQATLTLPSGMDGLLFARSTNTTTPFSVRAVTKPLEIAFINDNGEILAISSVKPNEGSVRSPHPYRLAIVTSKGFFERNSINSGDQIILATTP